MKYKYFHTYQFVVDGKVVKEVTVLDGTSIESPEETSEEEVAQAKEE